MIVYSNYLRRGFAVLALAFAAAIPAVAEEGPLGFETSSLSGNYLAGRYAGKLGDMDVAAEYFSQALRDDPGNQHLIERTFVLAISSGDTAQAEEMAALVLDIDPKNRLAQIVSGLREFRNKRYHKAAEFFRKSDQSPIGELSAGLLSAWTAAAERNSKAAFTALDRLDKNDAFTNFKSFHGGLIADLLNQRVRAEAFYKKAYEQAGNSLRVVQAYGNFLERQGKRQEAARIYRQFLANTESQPLVSEALAGLEAGRKPKHLVPDAAEGVAEVMFSIASALGDEQTLDISLVYAQLALIPKKDFFLGYSLLGDIYEQSSRFDKAIEAYDLIARNSALRARADIEIAINLDRLERNDEALARIDQVVGRDPKHYQAHLTKGDLLRGAKRFTEAGAAYDKAVALLDKPERKHWTVFYFRGIALERSKQWERAEADFRRAIELNPDQPLVLNYLGYSMIDKRIKLAEAMNMIRKAVELKPNDGYVVDSLGWAHFQLGEFSEAVKHLERAVELKPDDPIINDHLGDAYWRAGRRLEANFQWQHARDSQAGTRRPSENRGEASEGHARAATGWARDQADREQQISELRQAWRRTGPPATSNLRRPRSIWRFTSSAGGLTVIMRSIHSSLSPMSAMNSVSRRYPVERGLHLSITGSFAAALDAGPSNAVWKSWRALTDRCAVEPPGMRIDLVKNLPVASGLGGGTADAAATLRGLMHCWTAGHSSRRAQFPGCLAGCGCAGIDPEHGAAHERYR